MLFEIIDLEILKHDDTCKAFRKRAVRRKNSYLKARKFKKNMISTYGPEGWESKPLGRFTKNTFLKDSNKPEFNGWTKTKNKGPNHNGTYAPTHNYKHSDLKKKEKMDFDQAEYYYAA